MDEFGILVFGHTRPLYIADVLKSLEMQNSIGDVVVWLDGHQGVPEIKRKVELVNEVVNKFKVKKVYRHNGGLGFRKLVLQALTLATHTYKKILILEDDCFPTRKAIEIFKNELEIIKDDDDIFSVYGHPFLVPAENEYCTRFQGWGWATTSDKLKPFLEQLIDCYSMTEENYLQFVDKMFRGIVKERLEVTPPRLPSHTLKKFYAWDETLALLTAIAGKKHKKTPIRTIYNFGACKDSSRFKNVDWYSKPPFNMVAHESIWEYY